MSDHEPVPALPGPDDFRVFLETPRPGPWRRLGRCRTAPPELFFPTRGDDTEPAKKICRGCPVVADCRDYALGIAWLKGVWGGLSERERRDLRSSSSRPDDEHTTATPDSEAAHFASLDDALNALTARPGEWALVRTYSSPNSAGSLASQLRRGTRRTPPGRWDFEGRRLPDRTSGLWARYNGPPPENAAHSGEQARTRPRAELDTARLTTSGRTAS